MEVQIKEAKSLNDGMHLKIKEAREKLADVENRVNQCETDQSNCEINVSVSFNTISKKKN